MLTKLYTRGTPYIGVPIDLNLKSVYGETASITWGVYADAPDTYFVETHIPDGMTFTQSDAIISQQGTLTLQSDKSTVLADDTDTATITMNTADIEIDYAVFNANWLIQFSGTLTTAASKVTYEFSTGVADTYHVQFKRPSTFEDGFITITATEV